MPKSLKKEPNPVSIPKEYTRTCGNCKCCHIVKEYDQEWGMYYCVHSWCDKDRGLMDTWENNTTHYVTPCKYFEYGGGRYDKVNENECKEGENNEL